MTDFNDTYLLDGSRTEDINLQVGLYSSQRCVIKMDAFLFASAEATTIMGFRSKAPDKSDKNNPGYIDLRASQTKDETYCYGVRLVNADGKLIDEDGNILPQGSTPVYKENEFYASALAAAFAESGDITTLRLKKCVKQSIETIVQLVHSLITSIWLLITYH